MTALKFDFEGRVAIVTGGASGMGKAACELLGQSNARLLVVDRDFAAAEQVASQIEGAKAFGCDVTKPEDVEAMVREGERLGDIRMLFNNAGILGPAGPIAEATSADYDTTFDVNVRGSFLCLSNTMRSMIAHGNGGAIVCTASIAGLRASPGVGIYAASKFASLGLMRTAAKEGGPHGIRVNAICPGPTYSAFSPMSDEVVRSMAAQIPLGRLAQPEEMANTAVWLLSDAASFVNGAFVPVDGGQTA